MTEKGKSRKGQTMLNRFSVFQLQSLVVLISVVLLYGFSITFGYVLDDQIVITDNQFVQKGIGGIGEILTTEGFEGYFGEQRDLVFGARYRPLSLVMFAIENALAGNHPWLGHLVNILTYALLSLIILFWARTTFSNRSASQSFWSIPFLIALFYLLHPIHSEAVANIKGRDEILAMLFSMLTLWTAQKVATVADWKRMLVIVASFFLALLSKENSLTFLAVVPITLITLTKKPFKVVVPIMVAMGLATAGYLLMRYQAVGYLLPKAQSISGDLMNNPFLQMEGSEKWSTIVYTLGKYIQLLIFPHPLTHDYYPYHIPIVQWDNGFVVTTILVYGAMVALAIFNWKKRPWLSWSIAFFLLTLSIVSNLPFTVGTFMNERFLFMPSLGFIVIIAHLLVGKKQEKLSAVGKVILIVLIAGYAIKTWTRVPAWESGKTLNQAAIKVSRNSARINTFVATDYYNEAVAISDVEQKKRLLTDAKRHLEKSKSIYPIYGAANNMLSGVCAELYRYDRNIDALLSCFQLVATDRPDTDYLNQFLNYLVQNGTSLPKVIAFYESTGYEKLYLEKNNFPQAIRYLKEAEKLSGGSRTLFEKLSSVYLAFGYHLQEYPDPNYKVNEIIESGRHYANRAQQ